MDGTLIARRVELLPAGMPLPNIDDDSVSGAELETPENHNEDDGSDDQSKSGSGEQSPQVSGTKSPEDESDPRKSSMDGVVESVNGSELVVNQKLIDISTAEVNGTPKVGEVAKVEGYYDANGVFIVTKIEFERASTSDEGSSDKNNSKDGSDDSHSGGDDGGGDDHNSGGGGGDD